MMSTDSRSVVESLKGTSKGKLRYNPNFNYHDAEEATKEMTLVVPLPLSSPPKSKTDTRPKSLSPSEIIQNIKYDTIKQKEKCERVSQQSLEDNLSDSQQNNKTFRQEKLMVSNCEVTSLLIHHRAEAKSQARAEGKQRKGEFLSGVQQIKLESNYMIDELNARNGTKYKNDVNIINDQQKRVPREDISMNDLIKRHRNREKFAAENQEKIRMIKMQIITKKKFIEDVRKEKIELSGKLEKLTILSRDVFREIDSLLRSHFDGSEPSEAAKHIYDEGLKEYKNVVEIAKNAINKQDGLKEACSYVESSTEILNALKKKLEIEIAKIEENKKAEAERKKSEIEAAQAKKLQQEKQKKLEEETAAKPKPSLSQPSKLTSNQELSFFVSPSAFKNYEEALKFQQELSHSYSVLVETKNDNPATVKIKKTYRFDLSKVINTPINAISDQSPAHLTDKIEHLTRLVNGQPIELGNKTISGNDHPSGVAYCRDVVAKKLVCQGARQISSSFKSAFSYAAVTLGIWVKLPDFGKLVLAHLYIACPYLVPYYVPKRPEQSVEDYYKILGYEVDSKEVETEEKYLKKLSGIIRLYAAIVQSPMPPQLGAVPHPHGIHNGWTWLVRLINMEPRETVTATVLFDFLEVAGFALFKTYGQQFKKLLQILCQEVLPKIDSVTPADQKGPVARLRSFLEKCLKNGSIPIPEGFLSARWWSQTL